MKHDIILFDLDGTLTDPGDGITNSVAYALRKLGQTPPPRAELEPYIGPPLIDSFMTLAGLDRERAELAVKYYREYFADRGIFENTLYDSIPEMLGQLRESGATVALATSKPEVFARRILEHFDIAKYFDFVAGSELDSRRNKKAEVILYALECMNVTQKARVVMVGDRKHDTLGAAEVGVFSVGVTYGYGSHAEFEANGAGHIVDSVQQLTDYLLA
ncbi:MAG: HAD family hydrolase [Clostridia bacterium]|nr:HAD family hydrolase [Clostridia bacterium]